ncbi:unnamed protein product [Nyctereutes procyonoides]|uniref:(raccoon dog) hypothetical protein n=1 Tax=Nyctereutes procyonoides TaxID=34880 RepID=A0A811YH13_NYCPR|nr:unnamed protein product [Nyctereutes procyonoides]
MTLDLESDEELEDNPNQSDLIELAAQMLYGLTYYSCYVFANLSIIQIASISSPDIPGEAMMNLFQVRRHTHIQDNLKHHHTDCTYVDICFSHTLFIEHPKCQLQQLTCCFVPRHYSFKIHPMAYNSKSSVTPGAQSR